MSQPSLLPVVQEVLQSNVGLVVAESKATEDPPAGPRVYGTVAFLGEFEGFLVIDCPEVLAAAWARNLFDLTADLPTREERFEAVGQLINILGDQLLNHLAPSSIELPEVGREEDLPEALVDTQVIEDLYLACGKVPFRLMLLTIGTDSAVDGVEQG